MKLNQLNNNRGVRNFFSIFGVRFFATQETSLAFLEFLSKYLDTLIELQTKAFMQKLGIFQEF